MSNHHTERESMSQDHIATEGDARGHIDLERVCEILNARGVQAYVENTGGGCAAIYAGQPVIWNDELDGDVWRFQAIAGPGWFDGPHYSQGMATLHEFYVGPDTPDGDGYTDVAATGAQTLQCVAALIAAQVARPRGVALDVDSIEALGLDPTGRSTPGYVLADVAETRRAIAAENERRSAIIAAHEASR